MTINTKYLEKMYRRQFEAEECVHTLEREGEQAFDGEASSRAHSVQLQMARNHHAIISVSILDYLSLHC